METTKTKAERFKIIAGDTRLAIIEYLKEGSKTVGELAKVLSISQPSVSQNLRLLKAAGIVQSQKNGNWVNYSIQLEGLMELQRELSNICFCGCDCYQPVDQTALETYKGQLEAELTRVNKALVRSPGKVEFT
ncbi:MAG: metalloregulator ArsR/SmtB family transcription factor [Anaerolineae bacterium]|nr:metalloregulator ArsR/SmtB family transcription factor [Anaerolineae bacterium]